MKINPTSMPGLDAYQTTKVASPRHVSTRFAADKFSSSARQPRFAGDHSTTSLITGSAISGLILGLLSRLR
jgi:hypothetical protein